MPHRQQDNLVDETKPRVCENCPPSHLPEADHANKSDNCTEGEEWWIPRTDVTSDVRENHGDGKESANKSEDTDYCDDDGALAARLRYFDWWWRWSVHT